MKLSEILARLFYVHIHQCSNKGANGGRTSKVATVVIRTSSDSIPMASFNEHTRYCVVGRNKLTICKRKETHIRTALYTTNNHLLRDDLGIKALHGPSRFAFFSTTSILSNTQSTCIFVLTSRTIYTNTVVNTSLKKYHLHEFSTHHSQCLT